MSDVCQCPTCNALHLPVPPDREFQVVQDLQKEVKNARVMKQMIGEVCRLLFDREAAEDVKTEARVRLAMKVMSELHQFYERHK